MKAEGSNLPQLEEELIKRRKEELRYFVWRRFGFFFFLMKLRSFIYATEFFFLFDF